MQHAVYRMDFPPERIPPHPADKRSQVQTNKLAQSEIISMVMERQMPGTWVPLLGLPEPVRSFDVCYQSSGSSTRDCSGKTGGKNTRHRRTIEGQTRADKGHDDPE